MKLTFWGTRGSIAVPGPETLRYGGNTTCLALDIEGQPPVVLDAGSGIRALGLQMLDLPGPLRVNLLITHLHWDHLLGFLFFYPAYRPDVSIHLGGWPRCLEGIQGLFDSQRGDGHFPVMFEQLPSRITRDEALLAPRFDLGPVRVQTIPLNHPQGGVGLRFSRDGRSFVFLTDNELGGTRGPQLEDYARFCRGAQVLIHDAQYLPEEMDRHRGWGHSDWRSALELAQKAGVERLILTHHDPNRGDDAIDAMLDQARYQAGPGLVVEAAHEGLSLTI
ncbi:MAG: MBL fold metallo-hydrolase [Desulfarculus sp.]|nr:MBL fold metallo-hydrolase [Desulfarculus sp.]